MLFGSWRLNQIYNVAAVGKNKASSARLSPSHNSALGYPVILNHEAEENKVGISVRSVRLPSSPTITRVLNEYAEGKKDCVEGRFSDSLPLVRLSPSQSEPLLSRVANVKERFPDATCVVSRTTDCSPLISLVFAAHNAADPARSVCC